MSYTGEDLENRLSGAITTSFDLYGDSETINFSIYGNLTDLNIDSDTAYILQNHTINNTRFWDEEGAAGSVDYVGEAVRDTGLGLTANALKAQEGLSVTISNEVKTLVTETVSIKDALSAYLEGLPVKIYAEKGTGVIVRSETVLSETTYIPIGKFIAGLGEAIGKSTIVMSFHDAIVDTYEAATNPNDITAGLNAFSESSFAGGAALAGILVEHQIGGKAGVVAGAIVTTSILESYDHATDLIGEAVLTAYNLGKSTEQMLDDVGHAVSTALNDFWDATGPDALAFLDNVESKLDDYFAAFQEMIGDISAHLVDVVDDIKDDIANLFHTAINNTSPLVIDLGANGLDLISVSNSSAYFDLENNGFATVNGWIDSGATTVDAFLALDKDSNGTIDNGTELFGTANAADGFADLATYDVNNDGIINAQDAVWSDLIVWQDLNGDGLSQANEMESMDDANIVSIDLNASSSTDVIAGNSVLLESTVTFSDDSTATIGDVWFSEDTINTQYVGDYTADIDALLLPSSRGYGEIPALNIAMSIDNDDQDPDSLISLVTSLADTTFANMFDETSGIMDDITAIMYRWAGVDGVDPDSRGPNIDARQLEFLEKMMGQDFVQTGSGYQENPGPYAAEDLKEAFHIALSNIYARLTAQAAGGDLFTGDFHYDIASDSFTGITGINSTTLSSLETEATNLSTTAERTVFWSNVLRVIEYTVGYVNLSTGDQSAIDTAITSSDGTLDTDDLLAGLEYQGISAATQNGDSGDNTILGTAGVDDISGDYGNDTLNGAGGNDTLRGQGDNDTLNGGTGNDYLLGGGGDDVYQYDSGDGYDILQEVSSGTGNDDTILFGAGIDSGDLTITRASNTALQIDIDNGTDVGQILIEGQFNYAAGGGYVETIEFSDSSTIALDGQSYTLNGTSGDDTLTGVYNGALEDDTMYGLGGNDTLNGGNGDDTLYGGDGDDVVNGEGSNDTLYGGDGDDELNGSSGDDTLDGGAGDDALDGGAGSNIYVYLGGHDVIGGGSGDEIHLDAVWDSITPQYFRIGSDLEIYFDADNTITVTSHFSTGEVPTMVYDDTTSVDLTTVTSQQQGTSGHDRLLGSTSDDIIYGFDGDDDLQYSLGSNGNDSLYGGNGDDRIAGGYGNDYLDGGAGDDILYGNNDDDHYLYVSGNDIINEGNGSDILELAEGWTLDDLTLVRYNDARFDLVVEINESNSITIEDEFYSGRQVETLRLNDGTGDIDLTSIGYTIYGDEGDDSIGGIQNASFNGGAVDDTMYGLDGDDYIKGYDGDDTLYGGDGDDTLYGQGGNDTIYGGAGADLMRGYDGDDTYIIGAGEGLDTVYESNGGDDTLWLTGGLTINDISMADTGTSDGTLTINPGVDEISITYLRGGSTSWVETITFDDGFTADLPSYNSWLKGSSGNDLVAGGASDEVLIGYAGNDDMSGGAGADHIHGGDGDDTLDGGAGDDLLYGGDGTDTLDYSADAAAVSVDLSTGTATDGNADTDTLVGLENITGSDYADTLTGDDGANLINGGDGADDIDGGAGSDTLVGGTGDDTLDGGTGTDTADYSADAAGVTVNLSTGSATDGNSDTDTISNVENIRGSAYVDTLTGDSSANFLYGGDSDDTLGGNAGNDYLYGEDGNDTLNGGDNDDLLSGGAGTDALNGGNDADTLYGGDGTDTLHGDAGNDTLYGMDGLDTLYGDGGADTFVFTADSAFNDIDVVSDFDVSTDNDVLDIGDILSGYDPLSDVITDFVQITDSGSDSAVAIDVDGGADNFVQIATLQGITGLTDEAALVTSGNLVVA